MRDRHYRRVVVTQSDQDCLLLEALLDAANDPTLEVIAAGGWSGADSLARSVLMTSDYARVTLVVDAMSTDPIAIDHRRRFFNGSMRQVATYGVWHITLIEPEVEALFFKDRALLNQLAGKTVSDAEFERGVKEPRKALREILGNQPVDFEQRLLQADLTTLENDRQIQEIGAFMNKSDLKAAA